MIGYCSLAEARLELKATESAGDDTLMKYINQTSRRIDKKMSRHAKYAAFGPNIATVKFPISNRYVDSDNNTFVLRGALPLLSISAATAGDTTVTSVLEGYPQGESYFRQVRITSSGCNWYYYCESDDPSYLSLTGVWGYHRDYDNAWLDVGTLVGDIAASATTFEIADIDGDDAYGFPNKISRGHLLKIDDEYVLVVDTNTTTNIGTIKRGVLGSTAAAHSAGDTIYRWEVEEPIRRGVARQTAMMYARRGSFQVASVDAVGTVSYPQDLLPEIKHILAEYMNS
jgi:hypothetical protein